MRFVATGGVRRVAAPGSLSIDGRPAPADFVPSRLVADALEIRFKRSAADQIESMNIVGLQSAQ